MQYAWVLGLGIWGSLGVVNAQTVGGEERLIPAIPRGAVAIGAPPRVSYLATAELLSAQVDQFLGAYAPHRHGVDRGGKIYRAARRLQGSTNQLVRILRHGPGVGRLAARQVMSDYAAIANEVDRVAGARSGPLVTQVRSMSFTISQISELAGLGAARGVVVADPGTGMLAPGP
jgi:hypothetical protein